MKSIERKDVGDWASLWYDEKILNLHREDGPAAIHKSDPRRDQWWFEGKIVEVKSQKEFERWKKLKLFW